MSEKKSRLSKVLLTTIFFAIYSLDPLALADVLEYPVEPPQEQLVEEVRAELDFGADGTLESRLPPVIPGEEIVRGGKRYRAWSTAGPVPRTLERDEQRISQPGEPLAEELNVFIDRRKKPSTSK
jgi:hypothetical protein